MAQELGITLLISRGVRLLTASGDDLTASDDPTRKMMRQIAGAFAEYEKARLVSKLRHARERVRQEKGKCEDQSLRAPGFRAGLGRRTSLSKTPSAANGPHAQFVLSLSRRLDLGAPVGVIHGHDGGFERCDPSLLPLTTSAAHLFKAIRNGRHRCHHHARLRPWPVRAGRLLTLGSTLPADPRPHDVDRN